MSIQMNTHSNPVMTQASSSYSHSSSSLSDDQKSTLASILESYDNESISEEDAKAIVESMSDAGIMPGNALKTTMETLGFDAKAIGDLAGVGPSGSPPPPPPNNDSTTSGVNQSNLQLLQTVLEEYGDLHTLSAEEESQLNQSLLSAGLLEPGALIDTQS